jgi:hypothetical protein
VDEAEALGGTCEIDLPMGTFELTLDQLELEGDITIKGAGADQTTIDQLTTNHRAIEVRSGTVAISDTTITGGDETMNSVDPDPGVGGGIYVAGGATLDLSRDEITGNTADSSGGGVDLNGSVEVDHSAIANNTVTGARLGNGIGGGVDDFGNSLTIPIESYRWVFGDGKSGAGVRATHDFPAAHSYAVTLIVTDARGLTARVIRTVSVPKSVAVSIAEAVGATDAPASAPGVEVPIDENPSVRDTVTVVRHPPPAHPHK